MSTYSLQNIVANYELLAHDDPVVRENANVFLMGLIYHEDVWQIAEQMITQCNSQNYQLLGAQILHQKLQKDGTSLEKTQLIALKDFLFRQLALPLSLPTLRKLASAAALLSVLGCMQEGAEGGLMGEVVGFMKGSGVQLQSGLLLLGSIAEELSRNNSIRQGVKMQVKQKLLEQESLMAEVFLSALTISEGITAFALEALESWVGVGFPLLRYGGLVGVLLALMEQRQQLFFESCCKTVSEGIRIAAQLKFQTLSAVDLTIQAQQYSPEEVQSLRQVILFLRSTRPQLLIAIKAGEGSDNVETYTAIVKELLLSCGFLLLEEVGLELLQTMATTLASPNLKLSYSTFQFWLDFCEKMGKSKAAQTLHTQLQNIADYLLGVLLNKTTLDSESALFELAKEDDTVDDLDDVSFPEYRKEAQYVIKTLYEYFTQRRQKEGSNLFFGKLLARIEKEGALGAGAELAVYAVKACLQSMIKDYDTLNLLDFLNFLLTRVDAHPQLPPRLTAELLGLVKDCNREVRERDQLFLKCLSFSLRFVQDEQLCHYAVYAFQSLMESVENISSAGLINDLLAFYESRQFSKQTVLEKVLDGVLTSITKLTDRQATAQYFTRIMNATLQRNNTLLSSPFHPDAYLLPLIEIKTVLECFDNLKSGDKEHLRGIFLQMGRQGIAIVTRIVSTYLHQRLRFSNVNELGLSLAVCRNTLKLCENMPAELLPMEDFVGLMDLVLCVFNPADMQFFHSYSPLIEIISRVLCQFMGASIPALNHWLATHLQPIDRFFLDYARSRPHLHDADPDVIREFFGVQESVAIYSQEIFLGQAQIEDILELALLSLQHLPEKQLQRKVVYFLYLCVQMRATFAPRFDRIASTLFLAVPVLNSITYINAARTFVLLFEGTDSRKKENVFRALLEEEPYAGVERELKEIMAKFMAFAVESKVERYMKGVLSDLADMKWKKAGSDLALHLQMRFSTWKREYNRMLKNGELPK